MILDSEIIKETLSGSLSIPKTNVLLHVQILIPSIKKKKISH